MNQFYYLLLCCGLLQWSSQASRFYAPLLQRVGNNPLSKKLKAATKKPWMRSKSGVKEDVLLSVNDKEFLHRLDAENELAAKIVDQLLQPSDAWDVVGEVDGVRVEKRILHAGTFVSKEDAEHGKKHICIKSSAVLRASAEDVFRLFVDNSRVKEYNEHCESIRDVLHIPSRSKDIWTKVSWALSPKYGLFKARHFFSVVHFRKSPQRLMIVNRPAYLTSFDPPITDSIRGIVLIAGNVIVPIDKDSCRLTLIAQVNPGGSADSSAAAWLINKLVAKGPPAFIRKLEAAAMK